jgi:5-methylcytosine-specific restriction endonuclease McrA
VGACVECSKAARRAWDAANPERKKAAQAAWQAANSEREKARKAAWYVANHERKKAANAAWHAANSERKNAANAAWRIANPERAKAASAAWKAAHPSEYRAIRSSKKARRRARKLAQICRCCTTAQLLDVYRQAKGMEVDHIVPLALGGLHCCSNLQILTPAEHQLKTSTDIRLIATARRQRANAQG